MCSGWIDEAGLLHLKSSSSHLLRILTKRHFKRLIQIGDEVVGVLETDGEAHEAVGDFGFGAGFFGDAGMGGGGGVADQALGAAERYGGFKELQGIDEFEHRCFGGVHREGEGRACAFALAFINLFIFRVGFVIGVV